MLLHVEMRGIVFAKLYTKLKSGTRYHAATRYPYRKGATLAEFTVHRNRTTMDAHDVLDDR